MEWLIYVILFTQQIFIIYLYQKVDKAEELTNAMDKDLSHVEDFLQKARLVVSEEEK